MCTHTDDDHAKVSKPRVVQSTEDDICGKESSDERNLRLRNNKQHHHQSPDMALCDDSATYDGARRPHYTMRDAVEGQHTTALGKASYVALGIAFSSLSTVFSVYFPFWLAPQAAAKTYFMAFYQYKNDLGQHHFDTTVWTYGTDYALCIAMLGYSLHLYRQHNNNNSSIRIPKGLDQCPTSLLCGRIWGLLLGYAASVLAGAIAHQNYHTIEQRNTWHFRLLWTVCVGTVAFASQAMGGIGSELAVQLQPHTVAQLPFIPSLFWTAYGVFTAIVCALGWFSYQRPACDIFIAGITQFPSSFYMIVVLWKQDSPYIRPLYQWMGMSSFILNAPLLPMYPLLVQYTDWTLASVNTLLHSWLFVTWSMQAISLIHVHKAIVQHYQTPHRAVPQWRKNCDQRKQS